MPVKGASYGQGSRGKPLTSEVRRTLPFEHLESDRTLIPMAHLSFKPSQLSFASNLTHGTSDGLKS
jgi:hypothetical protein